MDVSAGVPVTAIPQRHPHGRADYQEVGLFMVGYWS